MDALPLERSATPPTLTYWRGLLVRRKMCSPTPLHNSGNNRLPLRMAHPSNGTSSSTPPHYFRERCVAPVRWPPARGVILAGDIIGALCASSYAPPILYIRSPAT
jgi:hypothetical protein